MGQKIENFKLFPHLPIYRGNFQIESVILYRLSVVLSFGAAQLFDDIAGGEEFSEQAKDVVRKFVHKISHDGLTTSECSTMSFVLCACKLLSCSSDTNPQSVDKAKLAEEKEEQSKPAQDDAKAILSAKRKQAVAVRWSKSNFGSEFNDKIFLVLFGDKGGQSTKCAVGIGNVERANSAYSLLLVAIYDGEDSYSNLSSLSAVFQQLDFSSIKVGTEQKEVEWFLTGDLKFMDTVCGHLVQVQLIRVCVAPKKLFKESTIHQTRTIFART
uniref:Uncharacterized protein n=1 Tax=Ditylenchus dipsaci TaxID=166011 RepID=A0A915DDM8_9BILA